MVSKNFNVTDFFIHQAEAGLLPDRVIRMGIRRLLRRRLGELAQHPEQSEGEQLASFMSQLQAHAITEETDAANRQHYELPPSFFVEVLGPRLKYSSALWDQGIGNLAEAEERMLQVTADRAEIRAGMNILELGCGWGSLTLFMATTFPTVHITAVTNSALQAEYIRSQCHRLGLQNVRVVKSDVAEFHSERQFDRIVSVEMFEHVRNYQDLFARVHDWLAPGGKLFVHIFAHTDQPYLFEDRGQADWMARHFFSGGTMPSHGLLPACRGKMELERDWRINGSHYARTLEAWLDNLDRREAQVRFLLGQHYPAGDADIWLQRWRMFFMACAELFAFDKGNAWGVSHYRFRKPD